MDEMMLANIKMQKTGPRANSHLACLSPLLILSVS